jgi:alkanesulfonate monooxygenase SsuD/methylene tetrahydromethanopterin reductase-like flavin-dependent oxidoreductase (luciferase family)
MRFAVGPFSLKPRPGQTPRQAAEEVLRYAELAEALGFDATWFEELEFASDGPYRAPTVVAAAVAARTRALRLGVCAVITRGHPLHIAEEIAVLDVLSNGRVLVCPTSGPAREREEDISAFQETLEVLRLAWSGQPFDYSGRHLRIPAMLPANTGAKGYTRVAIAPAPVQTQIPIWLPAWRESGRRLARTVGLPLLGAPSSTRADLAEQYASRRPASPDTSHRSAVVPVIREVHVAPTTEGARAAAAAALDRLYERYARLGLITSVTGGFAELARERFIVGDPDECIAEIRRYEEEVGASYLICRMAWPGMDSSAVESSMDLLARVVLPHFRMFGYTGAVQSTSPG